MRRSICKILFQSFRINKSIEFWDFILSYKRPRNGFWTNYIFRQQMSIESNLTEDSEAVDNVHKIASCVKGHHSSVPLIQICKNQSKESSSLAKCPPDAHCHRRTILKSGFCCEISESTIFPASDWNNFWLGPIMVMEGERAMYIKLGQSCGSKEDSCRCYQNKSESTWVTFLKYTNTKQEINFEIKGR